MPTEIWVALLGFGSAMFGSLIGAIANGKLMSYRIEQLEKKVDKHNSLIERTYKLEERAEVTDEKISVVNHRLADLERKGV